MNFAGDFPPLSGGLPLEVNRFLGTLDAERAKVLTRRLAVQWPRLREKLGRLYGHDKGFEAFLESLLLNGLGAAARREPELWAIDLQREQDPAWHQRGLTGYSAYVDKFAGTLAGLQDRIAYLRELGVDYLHLLPFLQAGSAPNDGGFAVASFAAIEPAYGDMDSLRQLCRQLRSAGISLCSDFVLNHVSNEHAWARAARQGDPRYLDYFHWLGDAAAVAAQEACLAQVFPSTAPGNFSHVPERDAWVWTTFYPYQWDLNYANPQVFADICGALLNLANHGVEAFRLDSTGYLWKRLGSACVNLPEVHLLLQSLRCLTDIAAPGVLLKAEAIMPTRELPPYFGLGPAPAPECHIAYHSSLMAASWVALAEQQTEVIARVLTNTPALPAGCNWLSYVRCHDDIGWNVLRPELEQLGSDPAQRLGRVVDFYAGRAPDSYAHGASFQATDQRAVHGTNGMTAALTGLGAARPDALNAALRRTELLYALAFFVGGLPLIYMGDELGLDNVGAAELLRRQGPDGRELHRPFMDPRLVAQRKEAQTPAARTFAALQRLARLHRQRGAAGTPAALRLRETTNPAVLGLERGAEHGYFNFSAQPVRIDLGQGTATPMLNVLDHDQIGCAELSLPPYGAAWLRPAQTPDGGQGA